MSGVLLQGVGYVEIVVRGCTDGCGQGVMLRSLSFVLLFIKNSLFGDFTLFEK